MSCAEGMGWRNAAGDCRELDALTHFVVSVTSIGPPLCVTGETDGSDLYYARGCFQCADSTRTECDAPNLFRLRPSAAGNRHLLMGAVTPLVLDSHDQSGGQQTALQPGLNWPDVFSFNRSCRFGGPHPRMAVSRSSSIHLAFTHHARSHPPPQILSFPSPPFRL